MHNTKPTSLVYFVDAGVSKFKSIENAVARMKRGKVAGLQLTVCLHAQIFYSTADAGSATCQKKFPASTCQGNGQ